MKFFGWSPPPLLGEIGSAGLRIGAPIAGGIYGYNSRVKEGMNPAIAAGIATAETAFGAMVSIPTYFGVTLGIGLAHAASVGITQAIHNQNNFIRQAKTPFSQRFQHSEASAKIQANGMRAIGSSWGHRNMGAEAGLMASRYGRH